MAAQRDFKAEIFHRELTFKREAVNKEARTVKVAFSSETPAERWFGTEILDHKKSSVDLSRLMNGAPVLVNHRTDDHVGVVEDPEIDEQDRMGRATLRFGKSERAEEVFQDVIDGIRTGISVGYRINEMTTEGADKKNPVNRATNWTPLEISLASVPLDDKAGVGRSLTDPPTTEKTMLHRKLSPEAADGGSTATAETPAAAPSCQEVVRITEGAQNKERKRFNDIRAAAARVIKDFPHAAKPVNEAMEKAISEGTDARDFNAGLLAVLPGFTRVNEQEQIEDQKIGMTRKDMEKYSIREIIDSLGRGKGLPAYAQDMSQETEKKTRRQAEGFFIPFDMMFGMKRGMSLQRDLNVSNAAQGGNFVQTTIFTPIIEILRPRVVCTAMGAQTLSGLTGNVAIPRQTGAATAYNLAEQALVTLSTQSINQATMEPRRISATNNYSKQLLIQSSVDVEQFMREDLMKVLGIQVDLNVLSGSGAASAPTGILNTSGIGAVTFGAAATWAKIISFETALATQNADVGRMGYVTTPAVRGVWKGAVKVAGFPSFLWENNLPMFAENPGDDYGMGTRANAGVVNGFRAMATNQLSGGTVLFGNFEDCIIGYFGGIDVVVDPYTGAQQATVKITLNAFIDVVIRHAPSFCASTDSGAQ